MRSVTPWLRPERDPPLEGVREGAERGLWGGVWYSRRVRLVGDDRAVVRQHGCQRPNNRVAAWLIDLRFADGLRFHALASAATDVARASTSTTSGLKFSRARSFIPAWLPCAGLAMASINLTGKAKVSPDAVLKSERAEQRFRHVVFQRGPRGQRRSRRFHGARLGALLRQS